MAFEQGQHLKIKINTYGGRREPGGREPNQETNNTREQKQEPFLGFLTVQIQEMLIIL